MMRNNHRVLTLTVLVTISCLFGVSNLHAQTPPNETEIQSYEGLFRDVVMGNHRDLKRSVALTKNIDSRDSHGRTALHVAAHMGNHKAIRLLIKAGADPNALDSERYDIVTISAVANDLETTRLALTLGTNPGNVTSLYDGTALIAAAHLGHVEVVRLLIDAGAPLDYINNIKWTALIESIVLGDGGDRHTATLKALVDAGADVNIADGRGLSPLALAKSHGYGNMVRILRASGAK